MSTQAQPQLKGPPVAAHRFAVTVTRNHAGCTQIAVVGEIDANSLALLDHELADQPSRDTDALVLDLSRVPFCSIGGVGALLALQQRTNTAAVPLELIVDTRAVRRALEILTAPGLFSLHATRASALAAIDADAEDRFR
ncbi:STAS domain-containing protein [Amycolatopsis anabasis]|uniref:STAS domain-containing protein n=1 Tax=Amycolatopsis anabasis TaxID=1840409 RepID=UPI00131A8F2A|nr:STAS domain-containing protein [Amycolatopsis anabasis]